MTTALDSVVAATNLHGAIARATDILLRHQQEDGHFVFELEADATIPSEYIMLGHFMGTPNVAVEQRVVAYLKSTQEDHGGWPLYHKGAFDISASVKAYYALKLCGEDPDAPHMSRARAAILAHGGAKEVNVFAMIQLALFGQVPWRAVPVMPPEIMLLPRWFPFHLDKVSYWSRCVIVPLTILMAKRPRARNPRQVNIPELFIVPPAQVTNWYSMKRRGAWAGFFRGLDRVLQRVQRFFPRGPREKAIKRGVAWIEERLNGLDGLGAIYPAMANTVMVYDTLGYDKDYPPYRTAREAVEKLLILKEDRAYCQPCFSPVWDTGLIAHTLLEVGGEAEKSADAALDWLQGKQILDVKGDWAVNCPGVRPGGWAFQYANDHYPDVDDTAVVAMALDRRADPRYRENIARAVEWILGVQSTCGGWGAFDKDNEYHYLNYIPFADHGALLDPPSADVSARCISLLAQLGYKSDHPAVARAVNYLLREQEKEGCWYGRWGTNYIYGTWSVLCALNSVGIDHGHPAIRKAVIWLKSRQRPDGGWGETGLSYYEGGPRGEADISTPSHTAWALLGLMAVGEREDPAVSRGIAYLLETQDQQGRWEESNYNAVGFPRVFYLQYHGYRAYFPLWALARYRNLEENNRGPVLHGM
ncbi:MAG TPA: squalene--hopene cyclase [Dongiaceae bacterium]|jgi:squalene-hopene/tetraprenyl-beta-curcumene cyclase|nr:squalene--hopene cyclase [Dongiaceae bacterium]